MKLNSKQNATLQALFAKPAPRNIDWADMERLPAALGADVINRGGSMVAFRLNGVREVFHRPHPQKEAKPYVVERAQRFLTKAGVKP